MASKVKVTNDTTYMLRGTFEILKARHGFRRRGSRTTFSASM